MEISTLIAVLIAATSWNTECTQTGVQNGSYSRTEQYTIDQISFVKSGEELNAVFTREWHKAKDCQDQAYDVEKTETILTIAKDETHSGTAFPPYKPMPTMAPMDGMKPMQPMQPMKPIQNQTGESIFEADFKVKATASTASTVELGMIGLSTDLKTLRVARGFGTGRNTMLPIIGYTARK